MIKADGVSKSFSGHLALNDVSFEVGKREVVGLLGPNGAGKTTMMRLLAGYLKPDSGCIEVAGYDVAESPVEMSRRIGYLPENCPLYADMRVNEYLRFRAVLKGVGRSRIRARVGTVKEQCGLQEVGRRVIGQLSKGYRQRIGLADVLVHEPELLVLDEPTVGMDPNQIRQVRKLIMQLSERHTILLSTHMLREAEAVCQRVMIVCGGRLVASDTAEDLHRKVFESTKAVMEIRAGSKEAEQELGGLDQVSLESMHKLDDGWLRLEMLVDEDAVCEDIFKLAVEKKWMLRELKTKPRSLEDAFVRIMEGQGEG